jgi:hypothetical protein
MSRYQEKKEYHPTTNLKKKKKKRSPSKNRLDLALIDPDDPVLIERELMKFKPGLSVNYMSRWI